MTGFSVSVFARCLSDVHAGSAAIESPSRTPPAAVEVQHLGLSLHQGLRGLRVMVYVVLQRDIL